MYQRELPDLVAQDLAGLVPDNLFVLEGCSVMPGR